MPGSITVVFSATNASAPGNTYRCVYRYTYNGVVPTVTSPSYPGYVVFPTTLTVALGFNGTFNIPIPDLTDNACVPFTVDGYVQPTCVPEGDPTLRAPFSLTYVPTEPCKAYSYNCTSPGGCTTFIPAVNCNSASYNTAQAKPAGTVFNLCHNSAPASPNAAGYVIAINNGVCCYECKSLDITYNGTAVGSNPRVQFVRCNCSNPALNDQLETITFTDGVAASKSVCARDLSWSSDQPTVITFSAGAVLPTGGTACTCPTP